MGWARGLQRTSSRTLKNASTSFFSTHRSSSESGQSFNGPTLT